MQNFLHDASRKILFIAIAPALFSPARVEAKDFDINDDAELRQALAAAGPGDQLLLKPARFRGGISTNNLNGTAEKPIVIKASFPGKPPLIEGGDTGIHLSRASHVVIDGLAIRGSVSNGINIDDGGEIGKSSHHITLKNLQIANIGSNGNHDGIKLSGVDEFQVANCDISKWGGGGSGIDMVGCHNGVIKQCQFNGRENGQGNGVQTKGGSSEIQIQECRFDQAGSRGVNIGGSTGLPYFRPADTPFEARNITVTDSVFIGMHAPIAFVGVDGANVKHNTIIKPEKYVFRILQENQDARFVQCRNGFIEKNLILYNREKVARSTNVGSKTDAKSFLMRDNCFSEMEGGKRPLPHDIPEAGNRYDLRPNFTNIVNGNLLQTKNSATPEFGSRSQWAARGY